MFVKATLFSFEIPAMGRVKRRLLSLFARQHHSNINLHLAS